MTRVDDISPELALVSPELAEAARRRSEDLPWETVRRSVPAQTASGAVERLERDVSRGSTPDITRRVVSTSPEPRSTWPSPAVTLTLVLAVTVALTAGAVGPQPPPVTVVERRPASDRVASPIPRPQTVESADSEKRSPPAVSRGATRLALLPTSGYVVAPSGSFMTDRTGRSISIFTLPIQCGSRPLVIEDISLAGPVAHVTKRAVGRSVTVRLTARIIGRERVRGTVATSAPGCRKQVDFVARLS